MTIDLTLKLWDVIVAVAVLVVVLFTLGKFFFTYLDQRIASILTEMKTQHENLQRLERDFLNLKAELPRDYVRREDFIRSEAVVEAKLDGLAAKIDTFLLGGNRGH